MSPKGENAWGNASQRRMVFSEQRSDTTCSDTPSLASTTVSFHEASPEEFMRNDEEKGGQNDGKKEVLHRKSSFRESMSKHLSPKSNMPKSFKPHPILGVSCLTFGLVPIRMAECFPVNAVIMVIATVASWKADYVHTGKTSYWLLFDRVWAPFSFVACLHTVYTVGGLWWFLASSFPVLCYQIGVYSRIKGDFNGYNFWHSMWHFTGVFLMLLCFGVNDDGSICKA
mmetsp:Transcript_24316/g.36255  ORF Transcript_24316/g.36255 Transcript_24316/m.36255 type:complete len:227 (-) Transcript_24316:317-997(-)